MSGADAARAFYLTAGSEPIYAVFHEAHSPRGADAAPQRDAGATPAPQPAAGDSAFAAGSVGVLLCPLFGNDDLCAYRARREWAKTLARAGHPTLRFDLPGTGDSAGGPLDPQRLRAWIDAVALAAAWLGAQRGCARVVAIGIGLGGLLCYTAASEGAPIDDLVLWSVPARGRTLVRQLRALSRMEASSDTATAGSDSSGIGDYDSGGGGGAQLPEGAIASAGFLLAGETVAALESLDLTTLTLPDARERRILLLDRDGLEPDARLRASVEQAGAQVTIAAGPGYGAMVTPPQQSRAPLEVFATVDAWLRQGAPERTGASVRARRPEAPASADTAELLIDGRTVTETPLEMVRAEGRLVGVLAEGEERAEVCAVLLNAGALRRIGPNRMWVETARRWASRGVPTLRIDLSGIGDSDGDSDALARDAGLYVPRYVGQTREVLDALTERGLPPRFLLAGLCSGAYWSLHAALEDERVRAAVMLNPRVLFWDWTVTGVRDARNVRKALHASTWVKLLRGQITTQRTRTIGRGVGIAVRSLPARSLARRRAMHAGGDQLQVTLDRLGATGTQMLGVFTAGEPVLQELARAGGLTRMRERANVRIEEVPGPLASHTLEPLPLQVAVSALLDDALTRLLAGGGNGGGVHRPGLPAPAR